MLHSTIEKQYKQKLREFKRIMTPEALDELRQTMPASVLPQMEAVLADVAALGDQVATSSWEDEALTAQEQQILRELEADTQLPERFSR